MAEAIGFPFNLKRVQVRGVLRWIPPRLQLCLDPRRLLASVASNEPLTPPWPRIIVSIGRRSVPIALALKRLSEPRAFAVHIQDPKVSARHFDWIATPLHDAFTGPNIIVTLGAVHGVTPEKIVEARRRFAEVIEPLPKPRVTVLLGGQSRAFEFYDRGCSSIWSLACAAGARKRWIAARDPVAAHNTRGRRGLVANDCRRSPLCLEQRRVKTLTLHYLVSLTRSS